MLKRHKITGHVQWDIYNILRDAFCPYRKIEISTPAITQAELIKNMQFDQFIKIEGTDAKKNTIIITLLNRNEKDSNEIVTITDKFRLFINNVKKDNAKILIISPCGFQTHVINYIIDNELTNTVYRYHYDNFKIVIPLCPGSSEMRILSSEESDKVIKRYNLDTKDMKKIFTYDPQVIWLGAVHGDIIWINRYNPISGYSSDIRRVIKAEIM